MPTAQMNVRIGLDAKRAGDEAFAAAGLTPTEVVRAMWDFAGRNRHNAQAIREAVAELQGKHNTASSDAEERRLAEFSAWVNRGRAFVLDACTEHGIDASSLKPLKSGETDALLDEAYDEEIERLWGSR